jgi:hypothetical protein
VTREQFDSLQDQILSLQASLETETQRNALLQSENVSFPSVKIIPDGSPWSGEIETGI